METYILRIYRGPDASRNSIVGLVTEASSNVEQAFHSFEELKDILLEMTGKMNFDEKKPNK